MSGPKMSQESFVGIAAFVAIVAYVSVLWVFRDEMKTPATKSSPEADYILTTQPPTGINPMGM